MNEHETEPDHLWDLPWFIAYREKMEKALKELNRVVTLPELRRAMKDDYNERYILDAIEASHHVLRMPTLPLEKFVWIEKVIPKDSVNWNGAHNLSTPKNLVADLGLQQRVLA